MPNISSTVPTKIITSSNDAIFFDLAFNNQRSLTNIDFVFDRLRSYVYAQSSRKIFHTILGGFILRFSWNPREENIHLSRTNTPLYTNTTIDPVCQDMDDLVDHVFA